MVRRSPAWALALALLSGCAGPTETDSSAAAVDPTTDDLVLAFQKLAAAELLDWKTLQFRHSAPAGGWLVLAHNFTPPRDIGFDWWLNVTFKGPSPDGPVTWFLQRPIPMRPDDNMSVANLNAQIQEADGPEAQPLELSNRVNAPVGNGNYSGILMAFASNAPWELDLTIKIGAGGSPFVVPGHVANGTGAEFFSNARRNPEMQGPVGMVTLDAEFPEPGWTHLETHVQRVSQTGTMRWDIRFPSGADNGASYGVGIFNFGGRSKWDLPADGAGAFHAGIDYVESNLSFELFLMHAPMPPGAFPSWIRLPA